MFRTRCFLDMLDVFAEFEMNLRRECIGPGARLSRAIGARQARMKRLLARAEGCRRRTAQLLRPLAKANIPPPRRPKTGLLVKNCRQSEATCTADASKCGLNSINSSY